MPFALVPGFPDAFVMRLDVYLAKAGLAKSREAAKNMIEAGQVTLDGKVIQKPAFGIDEATPPAIELVNALAYVGRGGLKLEGALEDFLIDPSGMTARDVGASTGGFTDCLLQKGAMKVVALDAGHDQLAHALREDPRVVSLEGQNARDLSPKLFDGTLFDLIVMDVSFISATYLIPLFPALLKEGGLAVVLIKPQFEAGKAALGKHGIVKDSADHLAAVKKVLACGESSGLSILGVTASPILGGDGNREFFACFAKEQETRNLLTDALLRRVVYEHERRRFPC